MLVVLKLVAAYKQNETKKIPALVLLLVLVLVLVQYCPKHR